MSKVAKATIGLMIVTIISKILGFGRELALSYVYGATAQADAYITAMSIPGVIFSSISTALATTFIPIFYEVNRIEGNDKSLKFANNIFNIVTILSILVAVIGFILAEPLVKLFAINFEGDKLNLAVSFTKIIIFGVIFIALNGIMTAWLQINGDFKTPGMVAYPYNIIIIIGIFISSKIGIHILGISTLIAIASQFFFLLPFAYKTGYRYKFIANINDEYVKKTIYLTIPVCIGVAINQVNAIIDRSLASTLGDGIITVLNNANRLNSFVVGIFITTLAAVIYPMLSKLQNDNSKENFINSVSKSINCVVLLVIPISVGAIVLAEPVVKIVFERGAFNSNATQMTANALAFYSLGMVGFGLRDILSKVFYALHDTKTPMINGAISVIINIVLNFILIRTMGYSGLALATSISAIICIFLLFNELKNKIGDFGQKKILKVTIKSLLSSLIMGLCTYMIYNKVSKLLGVGIIFKIMALLVSVGIGVMIYGTLIVVMKVDEVKTVTTIIKDKLKK